MIKRQQIEFAKERLFKGKALIIYGPRQAGKTTFTEQLLTDVGETTLRLNGDESDVRDLFASPNKTFLENLVRGHRIVFIDEAQRIPNVGLAIKILVDNLKEVQVIATGSSAFELASHIEEPLTGRKYVMMLLPFAFQEMVAHTNLLTEMRNLENRLIYGSYPEIVTAPERAEEHLQLIADSYLYKDLYYLDKIKKPMLLEKLVKALALQVGSEVSVNGLSKITGADNKTIEKYIQLLEQAFVIFSLPAYSNNVRNEIKKGRKIYFYDNGIINAITGNFSRVANRNDIGSLWENYVISERTKWNKISGRRVNAYFWRTTQKQEIDYIEENQGQLLAAEIKWNPRKNKNLPVTFTKAYPEAQVWNISTENVSEFLM